MSSKNFYRIWLPVSLILHGALCTALYVAKLPTADAAPAPDEASFVRVITDPAPPAIDVAARPVRPEKLVAALTLPRGVAHPNPTDSQDVTEKDDVLGPGDGATMAPSVLTAPNGAFKMPVGRPDGMGNTDTGTVGKPSGESRGASHLGTASATYPKLALEDGIEGTVVIRVPVDADGHAGEPELVGPADAALNTAALNAVRRMHFRAALKNGEAAADTVTLRFVFANGAVKIE